MVQLCVMIDRARDIHAIRTALRHNPVVALIGPRQSGKTTLARQFVATDSPTILTWKIRQVSPD